MVEKGTCLTSKNHCTEPNVSIMQVEVIMVVRAQAPNAVLSDTQQSHTLIILAFNTPELSRSCDQLSIRSIPVIIPTPITEWTCTLLYMKDFAIELIVHYKIVVKNDSPFWQGKWHNSKCVSVCVCDTGMKGGQGTAFSGFVEALSCLYSMYYYESSCTYTMYQSNNRV